MKTIKAVYIGLGCFIRDNNEGLAFVARSNRPDNLREREVYELVEQRIPHGVLFYVYAEAA